MSPHTILQPLDVDSATLEEIPGHIYPWLRAVVVLSFLSFVSAVTLLALLLYRLIRWQRKAKRTNQFAILIFNLLLADVQQSLAFLLNIEWLRVGSVVVGTPICVSYTTFKCPWTFFADLVTIYSIPKDGWYRLVIFLAVSGVLPSLSIPSLR